MDQNSNDKLLDLMLTKLDALDSRLDSVDSRLTVYNEQLKIHIYRTELLEENLDGLKEEFKPVQKHVLAINGVLKFLGVLSLLAGLVATILSIVR